MMDFGRTSSSFSMRRLSQPARGGSRMTVCSGEIYERASSDFAWTGRAFVLFSQFFSSSLNASLFVSTNVRLLDSSATERPMVPTPE